jgi:hypothetical protein
MIGCELAAERTVLVPVVPVIDALNVARTLGRRIVLVSDYYMTSKELARLIELFKIQEPHDSLFVSSDCMASKRSGRLYDVVCKNLGISPAALLFIGDNHYSDCVQARRHGIHAVQVRDPARMTFYRSKAARVTGRQPGQMSFRRVLETSTLSQDRNLRALVPCLFLFIEKIFATATRNGIRDLFFVAREGQALREVFDIYQESLEGAESARIRTHYLLVSRRSCYVASLRPLDEETFEGLFRLYRDLSVGDFLRSLGFDEVGPLADEIGTNPDVTIKNFRASIPFSRLCNSDTFRYLYDRHRLEQQSLLRAYVRQFGVPFDRQPLALVDVGWRGSIQDFLRAALPDDIHIHGFYLGLLGCGQPVDSKSGLVFANVPAASRYFRTYSENRTLFELLLCADHGSARKYQAGDDGKVEALLDDDEQELEHILTQWLPLRADLIQAFGEFCRERNHFCLSSDELERFAARTHSKLVFKPWQSQAQWLTRAQHRENFGIFATSRYVTQSSLTLRDRCEFGLRMARSPRATLGASFWPAFTLQHHGGRLVARSYALYRRLQDRLASRSRGEGGRNIG